MNFIEEKCKEFDAMEDEFEHMKGYGYMGHGIVKQFIKKSLQEQQAEIVEKIENYSKDYSYSEGEYRATQEIINLINQPQQGE